MYQMMKIKLSIATLLLIFGTSCSQTPQENVQQEPLIDMEEPINDIPPPIGLEDNLPTDEPEEVDPLANTTVQGPNGEQIVTNVDDVLVLVNKHRELPSDYIPPDLVIPNVPFTFKGFDEKKQMRTVAATALEKLFAKAEADGIEIYAQSGYRSYARQKAIFNYNVKRWGEEEANRSSARPGQSEHQSGLAMDITAASVAFSLQQSFGETIEGKWLEDNIAPFGFVIRYPRNREQITGYIYEPWHIRYVGVKAAKEIMEKSISIEEYLNFTPETKK
jgi:zinc D-Ala-D-Ala carboxypeptidase